MPRSRFRLISQASPAPAHIAEIRSPPRRRLRLLPRAFKCRHRSHLRPPHSPCQGRSHPTFTSPRRLRLASRCRSNPRLKPGASRRSARSQGCPACRVAIPAVRPISLASQHPRPNINRNNHPSRNLKRSSSRNFQERVGSPCHHGGRLPKEIRATKDRCLAASPPPRSPPVRIPGSLPRKAHRSHRPVASSLGCPPT